MKQQIAIYMRLSLEDVDKRTNKVKDESNSIASQRIHNNEKLRLVGNFFVSISVEGFEEADDGRRGQGHDAPKGGAAPRKSVGIG